VPLYDYDCAACARRFEVIHGVNDPAPEHCPLCGSGPVRKAFAAPAIHFKGSGWAKKERRAAVKSGTPSKDGESGSEKGTDKRPDEGSSKPSETSSTPTAEPTSRSASGSASASSSSD
jgi:putative FmdB family regulatory protein